MSYIETTLSENEEIVSINKFHWWYLGYPSIFTILLFIVTRIFFLNGAQALGLIFLFFTSAGVYVLIKRLINRLTTEQVLTNKRVFLKTGYLERNTNELAKEKIETISITQTISGRILGFGDLEFTGTEGHNLKFTYVSDPTEVKKNYEKI